MKLTRVSILQCLAAGIIFLLPSGIIAQNVKIDTSAYLPLFYDGALDYNLMVAAQKGYDKEVERLISMGADVNAETSEGATPLIFAVANDRLNAVKVLLNYDADPNKVTAYGQTPLLVAIKTENLMIYQGLQLENIGIVHKYLEIAEALIRAGADVNFQDKSGVTPINYSSIYGLYSFVDLLVYYGADINMKANDGTSPLMSAVWSGYPDIEDLLIRNGANIEARDNMGFTPFLIAGQNGDTLSLGLLIKNGVDIYEKNLYGWNAICLAIKSDQKDATVFLLNRGDKWSDSGSVSINPYSIAIKYGRKDMIELLDKSKLRQGYKFRFDQVAVSASSRLCFHDIYTGFAFHFKEPLTSIGFMAGADTKLWYTRVLYKESDVLSYQYKDKSSVVYAGMFKEFPLTNNILRGNRSFYTSLSLGYSFGNKFKGTDIAPAGKFKIIPELGLKWSRNNYILYTGLELIRSGFNKVGPLWARIGFAYNFYFDNSRAPGKIIRWY